MQSDASYELVPYPSKFFIFTHPDHLAVLAAFFGMQPPNVKKCRVLELGCGNGSSLIAHAFNLPESEFVGVDLMENHIAEANQSVHDLGLTNIKFHQLDLMEMQTEDFGKFDYITAHGLFSWIPDFVREKVLQIFRELLSPNGVGYISYNAYPGNHFNKIAQEPMRFFASKFSNPAEKVNNAVSFLNFLTQEVAETDNLLKPILQTELNRIIQKQLPDLLHDDLGSINQPFYFHEFAAQLEQHDLKFLAEAEISMMSTQAFSQKAKSFIESHENIIEREQYIDFFSGKFFRRTLFCHSEVELNHHPNPNILDKFLVVSSIQPATGTPNLIDRQVEKFIAFDGQEFEIDHPLTKMSLLILGQIWAKAIPFTQLLETAKKSLENSGATNEDWKNEFEISHKIFMHIYRNTNFLSLHLHQPEIEIPSFEKPKINQLARWQLGVGVNIWTLLNQNFDADDVMVRRLLDLMDGTRNKEDLLKNLEEFAGTAEIDNREEILEILPNWLENNLALLARMGMFV